MNLPINAQATVTLEVDDHTILKLFFAAVATMIIGAIVHRLIA